MAVGIIGGEGKPKILWGGTSTNHNTLTCEYPQVFKEQFVEIFHGHELIDKSLEKYSLGYQYKAKIEWHFLNETATSGEVEGLIYLLNWLQASKNRTIKFYPHSDNDFYIECYLDGDYQLGKIGEKDKYSGHSLSLEFKSKSLIPFLPGYYAFATGYEDATSYWTTPENAYDGKTNTYASKTSAASGYTNYLTLTFPQAVINKVGYYVQAPANDDVLIDVYNLTTSAWNNVVNELVQNNTFVDKSIGIKLCNKIRIRFNLSAIGSVYVGELEFGVF